MNNAAPDRTVESLQSLSTFDEAANTPNRSGIRALLSEPEEKTPDTKPSEGQEKRESLKSLIGIKAAYHGQMIPCKSGEISIRGMNGTGLRLDLTFVAKDETTMQGYIHTDEYGGSAVISNSKVGLNNYFRFRYPSPGEVQQLANELIEQVKASK